MLRYGKVIFKDGGEKGAMLQRKLISALNKAGVITVDDIQIEKWYQEDRINPVGCVHNYVLHDKDEVCIFNAIMESDDMQDESVDWHVTRFEHDGKLRKWVKEVEERRKNGGSEKV